MKKNKKREGIIQIYRKCWDYIKESKNFIFFAIGVFLFFLLIGFLIPVPQEIYEKIMDYIREILSQTEGLSLFQLTWFIISNNLKSTLFGMLFGSLLGIYPVVSAIANGYLLGFVSSVSVSAAGISSLWRLFPHGIFELPAVFLALGMGMKLGFWIFIDPLKYLFGERKKKFRDIIKNSFETFKENLKSSLLTFFLIIIPLLIIAGVIESVIFFFVK